MTETSNLLNRYVKHALTSKTVLYYLGNKITSKGKTVFLLKIIHQKKFFYFVLHFLSWLDSMRKIFTSVTFDDALESLKHLLSQENIKESN